jgi:hypothetical protein
MAQEKKHPTQINRIGTITEVGMTRISGRIDFVHMLIVLFLLYPINTSCAMLEKESKMKLEELVQKLDDANPWTLERVEAALDVKLALARSNDSFTVHTTKPLNHDEGLLVKEVHLRLDTDTGEMIRLIVSLSDDASCFSRERIKKSYPDIRLASFGLVGAGTLNETEYFWTARQWGHIAFGFKRQRAYCLSGVTFIPTKWE